MILQLSSEICRLYFIQNAPCTLLGMACTLMGRVEYTVLWLYSEYTFECASASGGMGVDGSRRARCRCTPVPRYCSPRNQIEVLTVLQILTLPACCCARNTHSYSSVILYVHI